MKTRCFELEKAVLENNYFGNLNMDGFQIWTEDNEYVSEIVIDGKILSHDDMVAWCDVYNLPFDWMKEFPYE